MAVLTKVAVIGGTGDLGHIIVERLIAAGIFDISVVTRASRDTRAKALPLGAKAVEAEYESLDSLTEAFRGFDAVVCTLPGHLEALLLRVLDAVIAAGVKRFIPSEFGSDHRQPAAHSSPLSASKIKVDEALQAAAAAGQIEYTSILGGPWIEWIMTFEEGMSIPKRKFYRHDGGTIPFGLTTRSAFGDAVAGVLRHPEETKNQTFTIEVISLTQNRILELVKEALPEVELEIIEVNTMERYERGVKKLVSGIFDLSVVGDIVLRFVFDSELQLTSDTQKANELLGVETITEKQFQEIVRSLA
ncbi:oxidoreductase [Colletotrichum karsti]|uniref:Oxidoreductase n=1 Tax=Colletotrichum karsti TaxID=1095194 RepID=A0A9P6I4K6_9PEZI|nr:oxidoreductase [Colletotrichum karsti]KAF9871855.1 oxidoreductase [Colletotrichum karsti]